MNIKHCIILSFLFILSCGNIELVLNKDQTNQIKNKVSLVSIGDESGRFNKELYSYFNNTLDYEYILKTTFVEKKENIIVKKNQVAEKIDYTLSINYKVINKQIDCKVYENIIVTKFSYVPKSFGYNFGAERSLEKLYKGGIIKNIKTFIKSFPNNKTCKK